MIAQMLLAATLIFPQTKSVVALEDPWLSPDKAKHFLMAGFIESGTFASLEAVGVNRNSSFAGAFAVTATLSLLRELHDKRTKGHFSYRDLAWDLAGGVAAYALLRHTERP